jgi:hypothetical protein
MAANYISGIHNYCDRWCERCFFTSRCAVYAQEADSDKELDIKNKAFWERLSENFSKAKKLLEEAAEKNGIDLNTLQEELEAGQKERQEIKEKSYNHPISKLSLEYSKMSQRWLDTQPGMIEKLTELKEKLELDLESQQQAKDETNAIRDCLAVIQWYQTFIHVKIVRALIGKSTTFPDDEDENFPRDSDGSAKIGLIAIDRSMQAWHKLYELMPDQEDDFLKILSLLERIKGMSEREFPNAKEFKRPGFDDDYIL